MNATLQALAEIYRRSSAGRTGAGKDYTLDWEKFLRLSGRHDGDARELAEQELLAAERASDGLLVIDRHAKSGMEEVIRLKRDGGEAWLFAATGLIAPADERAELARFFQNATTLSIPASYATGWKAWCEALARNALAGQPVAPFKIGDVSGNTILLKALSGVINWPGESLIRYASAIICRDSKALENLRPRLLTALRGILDRDDVSLENFGITNAPRSVLIHGPLVLELPRGTIDFGLLAGPVAISATDLKAALSVKCDARLCLTVENESVFRELAKPATDVLLIQTSFPGAATRLLFERLPATLPFFHFGDSDPAGFDILRDLREKTRRPIQPVMMRFRNNPDAPKLTESEWRDIVRLLSSPSMEDVHRELSAMLQAGTKGDFEQESVPVEEVWDAIQG